MLLLVAEAGELIDGATDSATLRSRGQRGWFAQLETALSIETQWIGKNAANMEEWLGEVDFDNSSAEDATRLDQEEGL